MEEETTTKIRDEFKEEKKPRKTKAKVVDDDYQWRSQPDSLVMLCKYFRLYRP